MTSNRLYHGHAVEKLKTIKDKTVDSCISSPPYKSLRTYHTVDQIWGDNWTGELGREQTTEMFIGHLMEVFDQVKRVLKDTGTCFVVIGDSYNNSSSNRNGLSTGNVSKRISDYNAGVKKEREKQVPIKSLLMVPEKFAIAMIEHGWCLRNKIIWVKGNPMPSPVRDRFSNSWEYVYFFTKSNDANYWVNEKMLNVTGIKPLGTNGSEGIDWDWKANSEGVLKKSNNWISCDYFFKTLYQPYAESTLKEFTEIYTGQNKKDYKGNDVQPASDVKRNIIAKKHPLFGGKKGAGGDNATYSGKEWVMSLLGSKKRDVFNINTQPFPQAHFACVDEQTEILTINGWKRHDEINYKQHELVATFNINEQVIEYQRISYIKKYNNCDELIKIGSRDLGVLVTNNHRNIVRKKGRKIDEVVTTDNISYGDKMRVNANIINYPNNYGVGETFAELIGWIIAEGHYTKGKYKYVRIYQNEGEKADRIKKLLELLEIPYVKDLKLPRHSSNIQTIFNLKSSPFVYWLINNIPDKKLNKFLVSLPLNELKRLFNGLMLGDGHIRRDDGRQMFIQHDKNNRDWFQIIALRLGFHSINDGKRHIHLTKRTHIGIRNTNGRGKNISTVKYNGIVWCPKTKNGTWIARRNGRIFITGNTFPEKLVTPLIECGSPRYLCSECGLPQVEVYDEFRVDTRPGIETGTGKSGTQQDPNQSLHNSELSIKRQMIIHKPEAKIAKCKCDKPFKQSIILDPFFGAGTVGVVAQKLHRAWIGIELQEEYVEIAKTRLSKT